MTHRAGATPHFSEPYLLGSLPSFRESRVAFQQKVMREYPDIATVRLGPFQVLSIGSPELMREVLVTKERDFAKSYGLSIFARPILGNGLLTSEGAEHRRNRRLLTSSFDASLMPGYAATMTARADAAVDAMLDQGTVDVAHHAMKVALEIAAESLFGADLTGRASEIGPVVTEAIEALMATMTAALPLPPFVPSPANVRLHLAVRKLNTLVFELIRDRRRSSSSRHDVLSLMLAAQDEDGSRLSDEQVRDEVMTLFLAGHETTAVSLVWTLVLLSRHADICHQVEGELSDALTDRPLQFGDVAKLGLLLRAIKESMRLLPPVYMLGRRAIRPTTVGGYALRKNQVVFLNTYGMHQRSDLYPEPERFDPSRFLPESEAQRPRFSFLPFGAGPRVCIGLQFALLEAQVVLASWMRKARFHLVSPEAEVPYRPLITLRPAGEVLMTVERREVSQTKPHEPACESTTSAPD